MFDNLGRPLTILHYQNGIQVILVFQSRLFHHKLDYLMLVGGIRLATKTQCRMRIERWYTLSYILHVVTENIVVEYFRIQQVEN